MQTNLALSVSDHYIESVKFFPRKTLEYFAVTYCKIEYNEATSKSNDELINILCQFSRIDTIVQIYEETVEHIEKTQDKYEFYVEHTDSGKKEKVDYQKVMEELDEHYLFGKSIFSLLLDGSTMDVPGKIFHAERRSYW